jgi:hypothetical protein
MKRYSIVILLFALSACDLKYNTDKYGNEGNTNNRLATKAAIPAAPKKNTTSPIIGERVNGKAILRDQPNGQPVVTLLDYVPLRAAKLQKDWYPVNIDFDITPEEYRKPLFRKGRKLEVNGRPAGTLEKISGFLLPPMAKKCGQPLKDM